MEDIAFFEILAYLHDLKTFFLYDEQIISNRTVMYKMSPSLSG